MIYGCKTGVFSSQETCHNQVVGFKGDCYKKYNTREEAEAAFHG
jgi:viroplasmin and RNaseH domain-containing protein